MLAKRDYSSKMETNYRQTHGKLKSEFMNLLISLKKYLDVKLSSVPPTKEIVAESIRQVGAEHLNKYIIVFGTVVRTGHVHSRELYKKF